MRGPTGITRQAQPHQILRVPRKVTLIIDRCHIWNNIHNARGNRQQLLTSPNSSPAKKSRLHKKILKESHILFAHETLFWARGETHVNHKRHQTLRLSRKMALQNVRKICLKHLKRYVQCAADPSMSRAWSETVPSMKPWVATRLATKVTFRARQDFFFALRPPESKWNTTTTIP